MDGAVIACLPPLENPGHFLVQRVTNASMFRLRPKFLFNANALKEDHVGLEETDGGIWLIYLGTVLLTSTTIVRAAASAMSWVPRL